MFKLFSFVHDKKRLEKHEKICKDHDFCHVKMPDENNKILKYNPGEKSLKVPFIIYSDLECLLEKIDTCSNNPEKSYTEKKAKHKPSCYSLVTCCSFDKSETRHKYYRGKDCIERFCRDLRDQTMKIINYKKKKEIIVTKKKNSLMKIKKSVIYVKKNFVLIRMMKIHLNYNIKLKIIVIIQKNLEELPIMFVI